MLGGFRCRRLDRIGRCYWYRKLDRTVSSEKREMTVRRSRVMPLTLDGIKECCKSRKLDRTAGC